MTDTTTIPGGYVTQAEGVLLSRQAAREVLAALDLLGRWALPRGQRLSPRLAAIRDALVRCARDGTRADVSDRDREGATPAHWDQRVVDTATAAQRLGITPGGVAYLCRNGRLTATRTGGRWLIDTDSLRSYELWKER